MSIEIFKALSAFVIDLFSFSTERRAKCMYINAVNHFLYRLKWLQSQFIGKIEKNDITFPNRLTDKRKSTLKYIYSGRLILLSIDAKQNYSSTRQQH